MRLVAVITTFLIPHVFSATERLHEPDPISSNVSSGSRRANEEIVTLKLNSTSDVYWTSMARSLNLTEEDLGQSFETIWSNGSRTITLMRAQKTPEEEITLNGGTIQQTNRQRTNRSLAQRGSNFRRRSVAYIFGNDGRKELSSLNKAQKLPHSAACKLSCGHLCSWSCSGILIGSRYVLTSAHCLDGRDTSSLQVGFLQQNGRFQWYGVLKANIPLRWKTHRGMVYDYAGLQLQRQPNRAHVTIASVILSQGSRMTMTGFPGDKPPNSLWTIKCPTLMVGRGLIWNKCDAASGSSGSGMFVKVDTEGLSHYAVVGVFSGSIALRRGSSGTIKETFNVAVHLTVSKVSQINAWTK